jgi:hypothetical protein
MRLFLRFSLCLLVLSCMAGASSLFTFTYAGNAGDWATATLTANPNGDGTYTAISGSGTYASVEGNFGIELTPNNSSPLVVVYSPSGYFIYDDLLSVGNNPFVTNPGLLFQIATGTATELNIFSNGPDSYTAYLNDGYNTTSVSASLAPVPEPTTLPLVLSGIMGLGFGQYLRRRRR